MNWEIFGFVWIVAISTMVSGVFFANWDGGSKKQLFREQLAKCVKSAEKCGLSSMIMSEINEEIKAARMVYISS